MPWKNLGLIFDIRRHSIPWLRSHAMLPTPLEMNDRIRIYFTGRDSHGCSRISFVDCDKKDPWNILYIHDKPVLEAGKLGAFDDSGTMATCAARSGSDIYLYYTAYMQRVTVPYSNSIGLAVSDDGGKTFMRMFDGPIVDRDRHEPYFVISPCVAKINDEWHLWYAAGTGWIIVRGKPESLYDIRHAVSSDGITWRKSYTTCVRQRHDREAIAKPTVIQDGGAYRMWFCYRGSEDFRDGTDSYHIGYAESRDLSSWKRDDSLSGIPPNGLAEWDATMQAYPAVIDCGTRRFMFYNGAGFGINGFGCAVWEGQNEKGPQ